MNKSEYEIQHFDFSAEQISLERRHFLKKTLSNALEKMIQKLSNGKSAETTEELAKQKEEVLQNMQSALEDQLKAADEMDRKNFSIPDHVVLSSDFEHCNQYDEQDEIVINEEITKLKQLFLENSVMIAALKVENSQYEAISPLINDELKVHAQVRNGLNSIDMKLLQKVVDKTKCLMKSD